MKVFQLLFPVLFTRDAVNTARRMRITRQGSIYFASRLINARRMYREEEEEDSLGISPFTSTCQRNSDDACKSREPLSTPASSSYKHSSTNRLNNLLSPLNE